MPRGSPTASVQANTRLSAALYAAVTEAAIQEKLEREGLGRADTRPGSDDGP
jgi:hypothetical protein